MKPSFFERLSPYIYHGFPVGRIKGIAVSIHVALLFVVMYELILMLGSDAPGAALIELVIFLAVLMGSVLLHELGHCYGAHLVGGEATRILLWPLGGLASMTGADRSPADEFVVVILGPAVSLALALVATPLVIFLPDASALAAGSLPRFGVVFAECLFGVNWMLFIFNMIVPLFPMDCARLIRSLCSMKRDAQKVTYNLCLLGLFVAGAMTALYFVAFLNLETFFGQLGVFFLLIAFFGLQSCLLEMKRIEYEMVYSREFGLDDNAIADVLRRLGSILRLPRRGARVVRIERTQAPAEPVELEAERSEEEVLLAELDEAVRDEDFVRAAEIRDKLKNLKAESPRG